MSFCILQLAPISYLNPLSSNYHTTPSPSLLPPPIPIITRPALITNSFYQYRIPVQEKSNNITPLFPLLHHPIHPLVIFSLLFSFHPTSTPIITHHPRAPSLIHKKHNKPTTTHKKKKTNTRKGHSHITIKLPVHSMLYYMKLLSFFPSPLPRKRKKNPSCIPPLPHTQSLLCLECPKKWAESNAPEPKAAEPQRERNTQPPERRTPPPPFNEENGRRKKS